MGVGAARARGGEVAGAVHPFGSWGCILRNKWCPIVCGALLWGPRTVSALPPKPVTVPHTHVLSSNNLPSTPTPPACTQVGDGGNRDSNFMRDAYSELVENKLLEVP